ncbi:hypothetical protein V6667_03390 [Neisseria leonii]|uniref:Periplasmic protein n=1 Tax=Neisseria leonii TaxID=2995413 RepID=A0A9X4E138_9NEIS|nr:MULTISPECIES: hypothetical protein [unclassified Neisseria]MDD9326374.1 hypothetical protein [Neisseria sp. 3986]MDD9327104.1 hypothetical protein [Neisseria sp. 51.81]
MHFLLSSYRIFLAAALSFGALAGWPKPAQAAEPLGISPNCDFRQLKLSRSQQNELRKIRSEYRVAVDNATRQNARNTQSRRNNLMRILNSPEFEESLVRRYLAERYSNNIQFDLIELGLQHQFFQMLNSHQKKIWLENCVR